MEEKIEKYQGLNYAEEIKTEAQKLKTEKKLDKLFVFTDMYRGKRYVAFFKRPDKMETYDKFMAMAQGGLSITMSNQHLLNDCFIAGDKELVENESMFCELGVFKLGNDLIGSFTSEMMTF